MAMAMDTDLFLTFYVHQWGSLLQELEFLQSFREILAFSSKWGCGGGFCWACGKNRFWHFCFLKFGFSRSGGQAPVGKQGQCSTSLDENLKVFVWVGVSSFWVC